MRFNKEKIMQEDVAIHCDEKWKAEKLLEWAHEQGYKWKGGMSFFENGTWSIYKGNTCYDIASGRYNSVNNYKDEGYKILKFEYVAIEYSPFEIAMSEEYGIKRGNKFKIDGESSLYQLKEDGIINHIGENVTKMYLYDILFRKINIKKIPKKITITSDNYEKLKIITDKAKELGFDVEESEVK